MALDRELAALLGSDAVLAGDDPAAARFLADATESRGIRGRADAVVPAQTAEQVAAVLRWCYAHDVPLTPRGGGTGYAGGAVPLEGGVVLALEGIGGPARVEPSLWRLEAPGGAVTDQVRRRARQEGLFLPPDPGASEQSTVGGNAATNAGGPHSFKYGVTGTWITGLEVVLAPGEIVRLGGVVRKDVAGYDLRSLLIGSEGTLGIITSVSFRLIPAPAAALPVVAFYADVAAGCSAVAAVRASGLVPAALEFLDEGALAAAIEALVIAEQGLAPSVARAARFMLIAEADGGLEEAAVLRGELREVLGDNALGVHAPTSRPEVTRLWRWRDGVSLAVTARRGGKLSEDVVVPVECLEEALAGVREIGRRHDLPTCAWGHAGDGNLHATFLIDRHNGLEVERAQAAAGELFELAVRLGGSVSGEHGIGVVKRGALARQWEEPALVLHEHIKRVFDPKGLLNPGKKLAR